MLKRGPALFAFALVMVGFIAGLGLANRFRTAEEAGAQGREPAAATAAPVQTARTAAVTSSGLPDLTRAAQIAIPSVPNISSTQVVRTPNSPFFNDPFFRDFFGSGGPFGYRDRLQQSLGSGVVV